MKYFFHFTSQPYSCLIFTPYHPLASINNLNSKITLNTPTRLAILASI